MSDVEILGRPQYRSRKGHDEERSAQCAPDNIKKESSIPDLVYEREAGDWWWCDDM